MNVGLTGNMCSGYEKVSEIFKLYQVPVFDADITLKFLLNYREDIIRQIKITFGGNIYNKGSIEPQKFNTTEKFNKLVDLAQPELFKLYDIWKSKNSNTSYVIFKSSILFERKINEKMNYNITVFRPRDERAYQLSQRGVGSPTSLISAYDIVDSEMDELIKNQKSDWTIHNYDNLSLLTQSKQIHDIIDSKSIKNLIKNIDYNTVKNVFS